MIRRFTFAAAAVCGMLLGLPGAQAADTRTVAKNWDTEDVSVLLTTERGNLVVQPGEFNLKAGELYRLVIANKSSVNHSLSAPEFAGKVLTAGIMKSPLSSDLASMSMVNGMMMRPGETVEWYLMPIKEGNFKFGCNNAVHAAAGMEATIHVL